MNMPKELQDVSARGLEEKPDDGERNIQDEEERNTFENPSDGSKSDKREEFVPSECDEPPSTFHFIIPNEAATQILVMKPDEDGPFAGLYRLPFLTPPTDVDHINIIHSWDSQTADLCSTIFHYLGLRLYVRNLLWRDPTLSYEREENVLVADLLEGSLVPSARFFWAPPEQLKQLQWKVIRAEVDIQELIAHVLDVKSAVSVPSPPFTKEDECLQPPQPWRRVGWFAEIVRWFTETTTKELVRLHQGSRLLQLNNKEQSAVFFCPLESATATDLSTLILYKRSRNHHVFIKSSSPSIPEALITKAVASHLPEFVPKVIAIRDKHTFLQLGNEADYYITPCMILNSLFEMQKQSLTCIETLKGEGIPRHGLDWLAKLFKDMLQSPFLRTLRTAKEYVTLLSRVEDLQSLFAELDAYNIPYTLVHGDYTSENIVGIPGKPGILRFIDWANCVVGHPFVDFVRFYYIDDWGSDEERENAKIHVYLEKWEHCETREKIRRAADLAYLVMFCENFYVLLKMYESAGCLARESYLILLKDRLSSILNILNNRQQNPFEKTTANDGVSLLVICKDHGYQILAKKDDEALSLPVVSAFGIKGHVVNDRQVDSHGMRVMIRAQLQIDTRMIRSLWLHPESDTDRIRCALVFESVDNNNQIPAGYQWVDDHAVDRFIHSTRRERAIVQEFFRNRAGRDVAPPDMPWRSFGWLSRVREWANEVLHVKHGLERCDDFHEVKTGILGTVWTCAVRSNGAKRIRTMHSYNENVFLKASILNKREGEVHSVIEKIAGGAVPSVVGINPHLKAFLTTGIGKADLREMDWRLLFRGLGDLQVRSMAYIDTLVQAGLRIQDCGWVIANAGRLLNICRGWFSHAEREKLTVTVDDIVHCVVELELAKLPLTLVHGDFHLGNIGSKTDGGYRIFDWGSAFIGIPLCDVAVMTMVDNDDFDYEERALEGYLSVWKDKIGDINVSRVMDLSLVYYWVLNLDSFVDLEKDMAVVEKSYVRNLAAKAMQRLQAAIQYVHAKESLVKTGKER